MLDLPVKSPKKPRKVQVRTVLMLTCDGRIALHRRPDRGLLAGLWELPSVPGSLDQKEVLNAVRAFGLEPIRIKRAGRAKHIFTHIEWQMEGFHVQVEQVCDQGGLRWASREQLEREYALPSAFRTFLSLLFENGG